jgi:hypothetical protein
VLTDEVVRTRLTDDVVELFIELDFAKLFEVAALEVVPVVVDCPLVAMTLLVIVVLEVVPVLVAGLEFELDETELAVVVG